MVLLQMSDLQFWILEARKQQELEKLPHKPQC